MRVRADRLVSAWDAELMRYGELMTDGSSRYVEHAGAGCRLRCAASMLLDLELTLGYRAGLGCGTRISPRRSSGAWRQDQELGSTQVGPQRAELAIRLQGVRAFVTAISRGQQKLLAAVLLLSQIKLFQGFAVRGRCCCWMILPRSSKRASSDGVHWMRCVRSRFSWW